MMAPTLLAFGFAAPWLLWGLALAAAPIVIHLLFRRRHRETRWAAMQFLEAAARKQRRWLRLEEWLLLALRTAIPLCAAIALAGPIWDLPPSQLARLPVQRVLAFDASVSMTAVVDGQSGWDRARLAAVAQVEAARPGDTWQVTRLAGRPPFALISSPTARQAPVIDELHIQAPTDTRASIVAGLETVHGLLEAAPEHQRREVYLFTDAQRTNWRPSNEAEREAIQTALQRVGQRAQLVWWESGVLPANTAVVDLRAAEPYVFVGDAVQVTATIRRFGGDPARDRKLDWFVNGRLTASQTIDVEAGTEVTQSFRYAATQPGDARIEVRLPADDLPADDRRGLVLPVRDAVRVLLVDGRPSGVPFENGTDLLRLALAPAVSDSHSASDAPRRIVPTVITDGELLGTDLQQFDMVYLCDVPLLTDRDAEVLRRYIAQGGAAVVCLGPQVRADAYNQAAYRDGKDWLPARLGDVAGDARRRDRAFAFAAGDFDHPILAPFRGNPNTGFELTQTFAYLRCQPASDRAAVVLRFDTGDPAIIEAPYRRGRVLLVATAVDRSWGTWAVWGHSFVPMMHETVKYLLSFRAEERNGLTGEPLAAPPGSAVATDSLTVRRPQDETDRVAVALREDGASWEYAETSQSGFYGVELPGTNAGTLWFARNIDPRESDPAPLAPAELREELLSGAEVSFDLPMGKSHSGTERRVADETGAAAGRWLLGAVLVFLLAEPFVAWNRLLGLSVVLGLTLAAVAGLLGGAIAAATVVTGELALAGVWWYRQPKSPSRSA
jgi:hypothetical protein